MPSKIKLSRFIRVNPRPPLKKNYDLRWKSIKFQYIPSFLEWVLIKT